MKKILLLSLFLLGALLAQAQTEVPKSFTQVASQSTRLRLTANATRMAQTDNAGVTQAFAFLSEVQAAAGGAVTQVNGINPVTGNVTLTTQNIAEAVNLYYTDARARLAFSATGPISYNNSTGAFTFNGTPATAGLGNVTNSLQVINAGGVVSFAGGLLSARPAAGTANRYYIATDNGATYFDNGTVWTMQEPAISGDVVVAQGTTTAVLATVNGNVGTFGAAGSVPVFTADAKGRITGVVNTAITATAIGALPVQNVGSYAAVSGVAAPAAGFLKFVQVTTDAQYGESDDIYVIKPSGKIHKISLVPAEN